MDADGRGWTRMLVLVIIALGEKKEKKKPYLMNGASAWLSIDAVRSGPSEGRGQRQPNNQHPSDCDNARRGPPKLW